jgi:hypothetical protein
VKDAPTMCFLIGSAQLKFKIQVRREFEPELVLLLRGTSRKKIKDSSLEISLMEN